MMILLLLRAFSLRLFFFRFTLHDAAADFRLLDAVAHAFVSFARGSALRRVISLCRAAAMPPC